MDWTHNRDDEYLVAVLKFCFEVAVLLSPGVKDFRSEGLETVLPRAMFFATH